MTPVALVISGFDPSNHAGFGSDIRVMTVLGVHPVGVITSLTAQIPGRFDAAWDVDPEKITKQLRLLFSYYRIHAVKIGMIQSVGLCKAILPFLKIFSGPIVVDPLLNASAGPALLNENARAFFQKKILPLATLVTPNLPEMLWLLGGKKTRASLSSCSSLDLCFEFVAQFKTSVLLKGGHSEDKKIVEDIFFDGEKIKRWRRPRLKNIVTHGTGCFLSSAITAYLSKGLLPIQAVNAAQKKLSHSLENPIKIDKKNFLSHL